MAGKGKAHRNRKRRAQQPQIKVAHRNQGRVENTPRAKQARAERQLFRDFSPEADA